MISTIKLLLAFLWEQALLITLYPCKRIITFLYNTKKLYYRLSGNSSEKRVLIIGGGFAGSKIARNLEGRFKITLIDKKEYFEFTPSVLRTLVQPNKVSTLQVNHNDYLKDSEIISGEVVDIDATKNKILYNPKDKNEVESKNYDYLVISAGSSYHSPFKSKNVVITTRASDLVSYAERLDHVNSVTIIGGGTVGVELAAEIITRYPEMNTTLIHSRERLLSRSTKKASEYALNFLQKNKIKVILNEKLGFDQFQTENEEEILLKVSNGQLIRTGLVFVCTGMWPNSAFLEKSNFYQEKKVISQDHFVEVNPFLQSSLASNVFVCGDICNIREEKLAQSAQNGAAIVVSNLINLESNRPLAKYEQADLPIVISLGKIDAILTWKNFTFTGFIPALIKEAVQWKVMLFY